MGSSFAAQFMRGLQAGTEEKRRKAEEEAARGQRELGNQITGRNLALQDLELAKSMPAPVEQLPAGVQGPPQTLEQLITIPGVKALGVPERQVKPVTLTDVLIQQRAAKDADRAGALELFGEQQKIVQAGQEASDVRRDKLEAVEVGPDSPLLKYGYKQGAILKPQEIQFATSLENAQQQRAERAARATQSALDRGSMREAADAQRAYQRASGLSDNYRAEKAVKDYATVAPQYAIMADALKRSETDPGPADLALIYSYMKILDPQSTVREGERADAAKAGSIPQRIWAQYNSLIEGGNLSPALRKQYTEQAKEIVRSYSKAKGVIDKSYTERAGRAKVNPEDVIIPDFTVDEGGGSAPGGATPPGSLKTPSGIPFTFEP